MSQAAEQAAPPRGFLWSNPALRSTVVQVGLIVVLVALVYGAAQNAADNMHRRGVPTDFSFWDNIAGFDIANTLIPYSSLSTYGRAFWVGLVNTIFVSIISIVLATLLGFVIGVARLSTNLVVRGLAAIYVEALRNTPLLLQLLFWYNAILKPLPAPRDSVSLFGAAFLNNRGLILPSVAFAPAAVGIAAAFGLGIVLAIAVARWAHVRQTRTGAQFPTIWIAVALILGLPLAAFFVLGRPVALTLPTLGKFNVRGGTQVFPEMVALVFGLVVYTASFIAEIVRAGIMAVSHGQTEAAHALGLRTSLTLDLVVIPQAMRVIIPPLTSQWLNIIKNSSLAVFIGYPDLVQIFAGTVLNQTGAAVQCMALTMFVYLVISLATSLFANWYNARYALVER